MTSGASQNTSHDEVRRRSPFDVHGLATAAAPAGAAVPDMPKSSLVPVNSKIRAAFGDIDSARR